MGRPQPAEAEEPPLATYRPRRSAGWVVGGVAASLAVLGFAWLRGGGGWLLSSWLPWLLVAAPLLLIGVTAVGTSVSVWPQWLFVRELWYRRWLRLDELTEVDVRPNGAKLRVRFRDRRGNKLVTEVDNLNAEPAVWAVLRPAVQRALASPECRRNQLAEQQFSA